MLKVIELLEELNVPFKLDVDSKALSKYRGGGILKVVAIPATLSHLNAISYIINQHNIPYFIIGCCSNILVDDSGFNGLTISTAKLKGVWISEEILKAGSGECLSKLCGIALENSLSGLENFLGIPGALGGAIFMNAGAFGSEIKDIIESVTVFDIKTSKIDTLPIEEIKFEYRFSGDSFKDKIIVMATLNLHKGSKAEIQEKMTAFTKTRRGVQPPEPSLGCVFKNNNGLSSGFLIDQAGLKGQKEGGAMISMQHANFIVNTGGGTAKDYIKLAKLMKKSVEKKFSIRLIPEFILLGDRLNTLEYSNDDEK